MKSLAHLFVVFQHYNLIKMSCDNLRFLSILANQIFQWEIQYAINIINVSTKSFEIRIWSEFLD